jgi:hypothetical protein
MSPENSIKHIDSQLSLLRDSWLESEGEKRLKWQSLINRALDERLKQMRLRDTSTRDSKAS